MSILDPAVVFPAALALRLGIVVLTVAVSRRPALARRVACLGSSVASALTGLSAALVLGSGLPARGVLFAHGASGFSLSYTIDALSAWFLIVLALLAVPIAVYSIGYTGHAHLR